ncbi:unnamed protein product, partial [Ectocarpus sp. 6 AP-2014]
VLPSVPFLSKLSLAMVPMSEKGTSRSWCLHLERVVAGLARGATCVPLVPEQVTARPTPPRGTRCLVEHARQATAVWDPNSRTQARVTDIAQAAIALEHSPFAPAALTVLGFSQER